MSHSLVVLMLRFGIPMDVWMRQPDGCIETAIQLVNEQDANDSNGDPPAQGWSG